MHSLLEDYLAEVEAKLGALPRKRREEEMREMRGHLVSSLEANRGLGLSEDEAAANTLAEFGPTENAAEGIIVAWRSEQRLQWRDLVGAAACTLVFASLLPRLLHSLDGPYLMHLIQSHHSQMWWVTGVLLLWQLPPFLLAGATSGMLFPRKALVGIGLAIFAYQAYWLAHSFVHSWLAVPHGHLIITRLVSNYAQVALYDIFDFLVAALAVRGASRWRKRQTQRQARVSV